MLLNTNDYKIQTILYISSKSNSILITNHGDCLAQGYNTVVKKFIYSEKI